MELGNQLAELEPKRPLTVSRRDARLGPQILQVALNTRENGATPDDVAQTAKKEAIRANVSPRGVLRIEKKAWVAAKIADYVEPQNRRLLESTGKRWQPTPRTLPARGNALYRNLFYILQLSGGPVVAAMPVTTANVGQEPIQGRGNALQPLPDHTCDSSLASLQSEGSSDWSSNSYQNVISPEWEKKMAEADKWYEEMFPSELRVRRETVQGADSFDPRQPVNYAEDSFDIRLDKLNNWWRDHGNLAISKTRSRPRMTVEDALQQASEILGVKLRAPRQEFQKEGSSDWDSSLTARINLDGNAHITSDNVLDLAAIIYLDYNEHKISTNEPVPPFALVVAAGDFEKAVRMQAVMTQLDEAGEELVNKTTLDSYLTARRPAHPNLREVFNIQADVPEQVAMHAIRYEIKKIDKNIEFVNDWDWQHSYSASKLFIKSKISPYIMRDLFSKSPKKNATNVIDPHVFDGNVIPNIPYGKNAVEYLSGQAVTIMVVRSHDSAHPNTLGEGTSLFDGSDISAMVHAKFDELGIDTQFGSGTAATAMATAVKQKTGKQYTPFDLPELQREFEGLGEAGKVRAGTIIAAHLGSPSPNQDGAIQIFEDAYISEFGSLPSEPADLDTRINDYIKSAHSARTDPHGPLPPILREDARNAVYGEYLRTSPKIIPFARHRVRTEGLPMNDANIKRNIEAIIDEKEAMSPIELARARNHLRLKSLPVLGGWYSFTTAIFGWIKGDISFDEMTRAMPLIGNMRQLFDGTRELLRGNSEEGLKQLGLAVPGIGELIQADDYLRQGDAEIGAMMIINAALTFAGAGSSLSLKSIKSPNKATAANNFASFSRKVTEGLSKMEIKNLQTLISQKVSKLKETKQWLTVPEKVADTVGMYPGGQAVSGSLPDGEDAPKNATRTVASSSVATGVTTEAPVTSSSATGSITEDSESEGADALHDLHIKITRLRVTGDEKGMNDLVQEVASGEAGSAEKALLEELTMKVIRADLGEAKLESSGTSFVKLPEYYSYASLSFNDMFLDSMARTATTVSGGKTGYVPGPGREILYKELDGIVKEGWFSHAGGDMKKARDLFVVGLIRDRGLRKHKASQWGISEGDAEWSFHYHHRLHDHPRHFPTYRVTAHPRKEIQPPPYA
ncbi:hypothetical protein [Paraburkholderia humisilvae]|nr:hypothetical protein [Paraburkholderia humisilvae]